MADTYRFDKLKRQAFILVSDHARKQKRLKYLFGAAVFQRLAPKAFACLKINIHRQQTKKARVNRAIEMHETKLKQKAIHSIFMAAVKSVKNKSKISDATTFNQMNLKRLAFRFMVQGVN